MGKLIAELEDVVWSDTSLDKNFEFPIEVFPIQIQNIITDYNKYLNYPVEFTSVAILALTSVTIGNTTELKHKWRSTAVLAFIIVQDRGHSKSHPLRDIFQPLFDKEEKWSEEYDLKLEQYRHDLEQYKINQKKQPEATGEEPKQPIKKRLSVETFTPEALVKIHYENPRGLIVFADEAKSWFGTFNQYSKSAEEQMWIRFLNGDRFVGDTVTRGNYFLPKSFVSIVGGIQPEEFKGFIKDNTINGLFDRILYSYPKYLECKEWPEEDMPEHSVKQWANIFENLFDMFSFQDLKNFNTIKYGSGAYQHVKEWQKKLTVLKNTKGAVFKAMAAKAETNIHRLAMILQALHSVCNGKNSIGDITAEVAINAVTLQNYFIEECLKVFAINKESSLKYIEIWYSLLPDQFTSDQAIEIAIKHKLASRRTVFNWLEKDKRILKESNNNYKKLVQ